MLKIIHHNAGGINNPDDPTLPHKLEATLRPPEFMQLAFISLYGGAETLVARASTREELQAFADASRLPGHPRLVRLSIT